MMVEYQSWDTPMQVGGHKYGAGFLGDGHDLLWIASFWHALSGRSRVAPRSMHERMRYLRGRSIGFPGGPEQYSPFTLLPPRKLPLLSSPFVCNNILRATVPSFSSWIKKQGWLNPDVLWISNPFMTRVLDFVKPRLLVHRMADDLAAFGTVPDAVIKAEYELVQRADLIPVTSRDLVEKVRAMGKEPVYVPNGVNRSVFERRDLPEPDDLAQIPHPRAMYVGAIDHWFDFEMLSEVANLRPDISFVLVGPVAADTRAISSLPNVKLLGPRPYRSIPAYLTHADVAIIPFKKNKLTDNINPIKLYEYLAAGRPVVTTELAETRNMNPPASFAASAEDFADALQNEIALGPNRPEFEEFAQENSWENRYKRIREEIMCRLK